MEKRNRPIAFFDSGVGGISVLREAVRLMPRENYLYFGDSANAPYGTKSIDEIRALSLSNAKMLYSQGIKALVVACNTATSASIRDLRAIYTDIPVIGIEPALKPAALMSDHPSVLVMATPLTVRASKFHDLLGQYADRADVTALGCPGLMEYVESGDLDGPAIRAYLSDLLSPYLGSGAHSIDAIVLGCTHYPFVRPLISQIAGEHVRIFDGGAGTARELHRRLEEEGLLTDRTCAGSVNFSESLPEKIPLCRTLLQLPQDASGL